MISWLQVIISFLRSVKYFFPLNQAFQISPQSGYGQIGPKWDKTQTFSVKISINFGSLRPNVLKSYLRKSSICPFAANEPLWGKI